MKAVTFRLDENDLELLERLSCEQQCSKTEMIRRAIRSMHDAIRDGSHGAIRDEGDASAIREQLAVKDRQIEQLGRSLDAITEALRDAQKVTGQAHELHYAEQQRIAALGDGRVSRWKRLKMAWKEAADE